RRRPAVLRPAGGAEPADRLPEPARGHERVLPEGRGAEARDAESDLRRHDSFHGHPDHRHRAAVPLPRDRPVAAFGALQLITAHPARGRFGAPFSWFAATIDVYVNVNSAVPG